MAHDPRRRARHHGRDAGPLRRADRELGRCWAASISGKGCYTGQEIIARTQYLGRLKERTFRSTPTRPKLAAGERIFSAAFGEQPCGTVVNAAPRPAAAATCSRCCSSRPPKARDARLGAPGGPALAPLPLPYALPAATPPRGRLA